MMEQPDPFELLSSLNPIDSRPLIIAEDPVADVALEQILAGNTGPVVSFSDRNRRRRRWVIPAVMVGVLAAGGAAAAVIARRQPVDPFQLVCQRTPTLASDAYVTALDTSKSIRELCAPPWLDGTFGAAGPPALTPCVGTDGIAYAIPGDETVCSALGYADYDPAPDPEAQNIREANSAIIALLDADPDGCLDMDTARREYRKILDGHGLSDWEFTTDGYVYDSNRPCIAAAFIREQRLVGLPGVPKPG
jgi:hypothetical protein